MDNNLLHASFVQDPKVMIQGDRVTIFFIIVKKPSKDHQRLILFWV